MADPDQAEESLLAQRKGRARHHVALTKQRNRLQKMLDDEDPLSLDLCQLKDSNEALNTIESRCFRCNEALITGETDDDLIEADDTAWEEFHEVLCRAKTICQRLISLRLVTGNFQAISEMMDSLEELMAEDPTLDRSVNLLRCDDDTKHTLQLLQDSTIPSTHHLRTMARDLRKRNQSLQSKKATPVDSKDFIKPSKLSSTYKLPKLTLPPFDGELANWHKFWVRFKEAVHNNSSLTNAEKLAYLRQCMSNPALQDLLCTESEDPDVYTDIMGVLQKRFDQPRKLHAIYCRTLADLQPAKNQAQDLTRLADTLFSAVTGIRRLGQHTIEAVATSLAVTALPTTLRTEWETLTEKEREVPEVDKLITFMRQKASNVSHVTKTEAAPHSREQKKGGRPVPAKPKAAVNVSTPQPQPQLNNSPPPPQRQQHRQRQAPTMPPGPPPQQRRSRPQPQQDSYPSQYSSYRYPCLVCTEYHPLHVCQSFADKTVDQRKDCIKEFNLCRNCLKCGHSAADCRSEYRCRVCGSKHNTLIHEKAAAPSASVNTATPNSTDSIPSSLLMTSQVLLTGPTGRTMVARALLDSGATFSLISTKAMKTLALRRSKTCVTIKGVENITTNSSCPLTTFSLSPLQDPEQAHQVSAAAVPEVTCDLPLQGASSVRQLPHIRELQLADPKFHCPGRVDLVLGENILDKVMLPGETRTGPAGTPSAWRTVFGWALRGVYTPDSHSPQGEAAIHNMITSISQEPDDSLPKFWEVEEPAQPTQPLTTAEQAVQDHYSANTVFLPTAGRYQVTLPRKSPEPVLGESHGQALQRFRSNERSLIRKGNWEQFQAVVQGYLDLGHAQLVSPVELAAPSKNTYYLPMHGVHKASSSTTKLRVVFYGSANTTTHFSLNSILCVGPTLHPPLDQILIRFRTYRIALSADISKMYREILLHPKDRQLHRFLWRAQTDQTIQHYCMNRVTFGIASSPYLAVRTLQQAALDFGAEAPTASWHVTNSFYVDDLLGGADSEEAAEQLFGELRCMLGKGGFDLKKWRSNSLSVLSHIPVDLIEPMPEQDLVDRHSASHPKALGVAWNSATDSMATHISMPTQFTSTKRGIISDVSKTFDILGWLAPSILPMKVLFQQLWEHKLGWDDPVPDAYRQKHAKWRTELPLLASVTLSRCYYTSESAITVELHGFSDASEVAYAAVVYLRATYSTQPTTCRLVVAKTKVAPVKTLSIPRLELCGASLLAKLLHSTQQTLSIPVTSTFAWCDSTIVLAWLDGSPKRYKTYVGNRIATVTNLVPSGAWRHVPTLENPADCASRGVSPKELRDHQLWWTGPPWLLDNPISVPAQPRAADLAELQATEEKQVVCNLVLTPPPEWLERRYSSFTKLVRVLAWVNRFVSYFISSLRPQQLLFSTHLTTSELHTAEKFLLRASQQRAFQSELKQLCSSPPKPLFTTSRLLCLHPILGQDGLLRAGGRLSKAPLSPSQQFPIILASQDHLTLLMFNCEHIRLGHCGPTLLLSHTGCSYHVLGARRLARSVCSQCIVCRKAAAKGSHQLMGQLPAARATPSPPFHTTGVDYAGPFSLKLGRVRKPVIVKAYLAIFICFSTKAVHLEVVSDLTTNAFVSSLKRFVSRRGLPHSIQSDNGTNFVGARNELADLYRFLEAADTLDSIHSYLLSNKISWQHIPERAPHFGGLWEAAVKSAKHHLRRVIGQQTLTFEEFTTVAAQVEACLNSRPLGPLTSHSPDGQTPLTPGHFLVGRPLQAYPEHSLPKEPSAYKRWVLCQSLIQHFWNRWSGEYLQHLQKFQKWRKQTRNFQPGDLVLLTDGSTFATQWVTGRVVATFPGKDGLVRAVDVSVPTLHKPLPTTTNPTVFSNQLKVKHSVFSRPITRLALLLPAEPELHPSDVVPSP